MGECIGLDFGTTYSVVARINESGKPEAIDFGNEEQSITAQETLLVRTDGEISIGYHAVPMIEEDTAEIYKGFKLLLNAREGDPNLKARGYTGRNTPEAITSLYINALFKEVGISTPSCRTIDKVVVGVPYVWTTEGADSRKFSVAEIVKRETNAAEVEFREEPSLACGYFVNEINRLRESNFTGYILVIDYGGGTLDVTLCKVENDQGKSNIKIINSWGAGENTEGKVGNAGMAFMESVADITLAEKGITVTDKNDSEYQSFIKSIESGIKRQTIHLKNCLEKYVLYFTKNGPKFGNEVVGVKAYYRGTKYAVTYSTLVQAYESSIQHVLKAVLDQAKADMDAAHIPYDDFHNGTFKIATIGGFCNFSLTEKQIRQDTKWLQKHGDTDTRYTELDEAVKPKNRELAIAYGGALAANEIIVIQRQLPYTLYFYGDTKECGFPVWHQNDEYKPGKPMFLLNPQTGEKQMVGGREIPFICRERDGCFSEIVRPTSNMELSGDVASMYIAMAMEKYENLTLYVYDQGKFDALSKDEQEEPVNSALIRNVPLPNIDKLLGTFYAISRRAENV